MEQMYPFAYLQHMSVCQTMNWELVKPISRVCLGKIGAREAFTIGHGRDVLGLQPNLVRAEYSIGETPQLVAAFIRQFMDVRSDFPLEFRAIGWIHSIKKYGGGRIVEYALTEFENLLLQAGLYRAVRAIQYGIPQSTQHFYAILERYNLDIYMFFTPIREMGLALHEM